MSRLCKNFKWVLQDLGNVSSSAVGSIWFGGHLVTVTSSFRITHKIFFDTENFLKNLVKRNPSSFLWNNYGTWKVDTIQNSSRRPNFWMSSVSPSYLLCYSCETWNDLSGLIWEYAYISFLMRSETYLLAGKSN